MKNLQSFFLLLFFLFSFSSTAQEQISMASISKGFSAGVHLAYISHENNSFHSFPEYGYGFGVRIQYGFNHTMAAALSYQNYFVKARSGNSINVRYQLYEYDVIGEYTFGTSTSRLRPNLQAGINVTTTDEGYILEELNGFQYVGATFEFYGFTFLVGGGLNYYFSPNISANLRIIVHTGQFNKYYRTPEFMDTEKFKINSDVFDLNSLLGFQYHF